MIHGRLFNIVSDERIGSLPPGLTQQKSSFLEISKLLDRQFAEHAFQLRVADLTCANQDALKRYHWPGNFDELREIADAIIAHARFGGLRPAAGSLGMSSHKKLARRFERVGLGFPLFGPDE